MYAFGGSKFGDYLALTMVGLLLLLNQYGILWKAYGYQCSSYCKFLLHKESYEIVEAEVVSTEEHCVAGLRRSLGWNITYCNINFKYGRGIIYATIKNYPDAKIGDKISVAVNRNDVLNIERTTPYSIKNYLWIAQIVYLIFEIGFIMFVRYMIDYHRYN